MTDDLDQNQMESNRKLWEQWVPIHIKSKFYNVDNFLEGGDSLNSLELEEMG